MTPKPSAAGAETGGTAGLLNRLRRGIPDRLGPPTRVRPVLIAYSGGADSTALLHAAKTVWPDAVTAIHIHHGLQDQADHFADHCARTCSEWGVPLSLIRAQVRASPGASVEEEARVVRYRELAREALAQQAVACLLAHHATDQLETVLLALSRGAGVHGLAGMPAWRKVQGQVFWRPWLDVAGSDLRQYLQTHGLEHVEDPSNAEVRWTRNRIRHAVLPVLEVAFPAIADTVVRSARHSAAAARLLDELAAQDLGVVQSPPRLAALRTLADDRMDNLLRYWLRQEAGRAPSTRQLIELVRQIRSATTRGHRIQLRVAGGWVHRVDDRLVYRPGSWGTLPKNGEGAEGTGIR